MAVESDKLHSSPPARIDLAQDAALWIVPALCALFAGLFRQRCAPSRTTAGG